MVYYLHGCMWLLLGSMFILSLAGDELGSCGLCRVLICQAVGVGNGARWVSGADAVVESFRLYCAHFFVC